MRKENIVLIGNGMAGIRTIEEKKKNRIALLLPFSEKNRTQIIIVFCSPKCCRETATSMKLF